MDCILHIGSAKTGSSALQAILYNARDKLAARGWIYPTSCLWHSDRSHNRLAIYFWDNYLENFKTSTFEDVIDRLVHEIDPSQNLVISSEMLENCVISGNRNFHYFLSLLRDRGFRISIVYVVRRQDHLVDSQFKQAVRDANAQYYGSPDRFIEARVGRLKHARIASLWRALPGVEKVAVVPYLEGRVRPIFSRILGAMGFAELLPEEAAIPRANRSLDGAHLRLKHFLNRYELSGPLQQKLGGRLVGNRVPPTDCIRLTLFTPEARRAFLENYRDDFVQLDAMFNLGSKGWLDEIPPPCPLFTPMAAGEVPAAIERLARFDAPLAAEVRSAVRQAPPKQ